MSKTRATVQKVLEVNFGINNVKHTEVGFKAFAKVVTVEMAANTGAIKELLQVGEYRRTGNQIVFVAELYPEDRENQ